MGTTLAQDGRPKLWTVRSFVNEEQEVPVIVRSAPAASSKLASLDRASSASESTGDDSFGQTLDQLLASGDSASVPTEPVSNSQGSDRSADSADSQPSTSDTDAAREDSDAGSEVRTETPTETSTDDATEHSEERGTTDSESEPDPIDESNVDEEAAELPRAQDEISIEALLAEIRAAQGEEVVRAPLVETAPAEPAPVTETATTEIPSQEVPPELELPTAKLPNLAEGSETSRTATPTEEVMIPTASQAAGESKSEELPASAERAEPRSIEVDSAADATTDEVATEVATRATKETQDTERAETQAKTVDPSSAELTKGDAEQATDEASSSDEVPKAPENRASETGESKETAKRDDSNASDRHRDGKATREAAKAAESVVPDLERAARQAERAILEQGKMRVETRPTEMTHSRAERSEAIVEPKGNVESNAPRSAQTAAPNELATESSIETEPAASAGETAMPTAPRRDDPLLRLDPALSKLERALEPAGTPTIVQWNPATMRADATPAAFASGTVTTPVPLAAIYSQIKAQIQSGAQELKIRLDPPALGQLNLRFVVDGDTIAVHVRASRPEVVEALKNDLAGFSETLRENGIDLSKLEISLDERSPSDARHAFQEQMEHADGVADEEAMPPTSQTNQRSPVEPAGERSALLDIMA